MKALLLKKTAYALSYIICALLMEVVLFYAMGLGLFPQYFWLNLAALTMIALVIFIVPSFNVQAVMILALLLLQAVISFVNQSLYSTDENIFSLDMLSLGKEVAGAFDPNFVSFPLLFGLLSIMFFECCVLFILRRFRVRQCFKLRCVTTLLVIFCLMQIGATSAYNITIETFASEKIDNEFYVIKSDSYLYDTFYTKHKAFKKFGTFAFYLKNISNVFNEFINVSDQQYEENRKQELSKVNNYFASQQDISSVSSKNGAFAGSNLIVVMIESGEWYGIDKDLTPTLYALANDGIKMNNFYAKNKTNISEAISILGSYPKKSVFSKNIFYKNTLQNNDYSFTLPSILKEQNYKSSYFHNNFNTFYDRSILMPSFGFDNAYFLEDMPALKGSGLLEGQEKKYKFDDLDSDRLMFESNLEKIAPTNGDSFFSFLTSITMHGNYDDLKNYGDYPFDGQDNQEHLKAEFSKKCNVKGMEEYYELITRQVFDQKFAAFNNNTLSENQMQELYLRYKRYQAAYMDLDRGMYALVNHLQENNMLENTTILMYADHSAYFHDMNYLLKDVKLGDYSQPAVYNVPFFIYNGQMPLNISGEKALNHVPNHPLNFGALSVDKFCSTYDILPTLLDLYGYKYNVGLYHGISTLKSEYGIFSSMSSGYFDNNFYTSDGESLQFPNQYTQQEQDEFLKRVVAFIDKQDIYEQMYKYDYFAYAKQYALLDMENLLTKSI